MSSQLTTPNPPSIFKLSAEKIKQSISSFGSKLTSVEAYQEICGAIQGMASSIKRVKEHYDPKIADARVPWDNLCQEKKDVLDTIAQAQTMANRLKFEYEQEDERNRLAEERELQAVENARIQREAKELAEKLKASGDKAGAREVLAEAKVTTAVITVPTSVPKMAGMVNRKPVFEYEIIDATKVNESYLHKVPNDKKIGDLVKGLGFGAEQLIGKGSIKITRKIPNTVVRGAK
jgi:uncharacterized protein YeeX (DUF496 family)